mmetsp:Transcript_14921/g.23154  ORF Transcript_14921/g.23154 Transcript_14921/m.23154 type:complete len:198 (-) Transcript_14921:117-710(-)
MLLFITVGVSIACVKDGKGIDVNMMSLIYASISNIAAAALKVFVSGPRLKALRADESKNMDSANVYAVTNIISFLCTLPLIMVEEFSTLNNRWEAVSVSHNHYDLTKNVILSGFFYYIYNELAFVFYPQVGFVTSSVLNTAKRVIVIAASAFIFDEKMGRNTIIGATMTIMGTFLYSLVSMNSTGRVAKVTSRQKVT